MNKRQTKKLLFKAIRELNDDVAESLEEPKISDDDVLKVYKRIKNNKQAIIKTLSDYKKHILWNR